VLGSNEFRCVLADDANSTCRVTASRSAALQFGWLRCIAGDVVRPGLGSCRAWRERGVVLACRAKAAADQRIGFVDLRSDARGGPCCRRRRRRRRRAPGGSWPRSARRRRRRSSRPARLADAERIHHRDDIAGHQLVGVRPRIPRASPMATALSMTMTRYATVVSRAIWLAKLPRGPSPPWRRMIVLRSSPRRRTCTRLLAPSCSTRCSTPPAGRVRPRAGETGSGPGRRVAAARANREGREASRSSRAPPIFAKPRRKHAVLRINAPQAAKNGHVNCGSMLQAQKKKHAGALRMGRRETQGALGEFLQNTIPLCDCNAASPKRPLRPVLPAGMIAAVDHQGNHHDQRLRHPHRRAGEKRGVQRIYGIPGAGESRCRRSLLRNSKIELVLTRP